MDKQRDPNLILLARFTLSLVHIDTLSLAVRHSHSGIDYRKAFVTAASLDTLRFKTVT